MDQSDEPPSTRFALEQWVAATRQAQGLPAHVEDYEALLRIATILGLLSETAQIEQENSYCRSRQRRCPGRSRRRCRPRRDRRRGPRPARPSRRRGRAGRHQRTAPGQRAQARARLLPEHLTEPHPRGGRLSSPADIGQRVRPRLIAATAIVRAGPALMRLGNPSVPPHAWWLSVARCTGPG
jgi:hypothetical protein